MPGIPDRDRVESALQTLKSHGMGYLWEVNELPDGNFSLILPAIRPGMPEMVALRKFETSYYCRNGFTRYDRREDEEGKTTIEISDPEVLDALANGNLEALKNFKALSESVESSISTSSSLVTGERVTTEKDKLIALQIWEAFERYYLELQKEHGDKWYNAPPFSFVGGLKNLLGLGNVNGIPLTREEVITMLQAEDSSSIEKKLTRIKDFLDYINNDKVQKKGMDELKQDKNFEKLVNNVYAQLEQIKPEPFDVISSTSKVTQQLKNRSQKNFPDFFGVKELSDADASGAKSHKVIIAKKEFRRKDFPEGLTAAEVIKLSGELEQKAQYRHHWYFKHENDRLAANNEVVAQELFRLFIPNHPKTRLVLGEQGETSVVSREVPGFQPLEKMDPHVLNQRLKDGTYKGLGEVMVMALWLNEADLKLGNMGVDKDGKVVKLDGGWCLAQLRSPQRKMTITETTLRHLPANLDINPYNWLDRINMDRTGKTPIVANVSMSFNPQFRQEVNEAIMRILLCPDNSLREFAHYYAHESVQADKIINLLEERKVQLHQAACQNVSFCQFMQTEQAEKLAESFVRQSSDFILTGKTRLSDSGRVDAILAEFALLRDITKVSKAAPAQSAATVTQANTTPIKKPGSKI